MWCGAARSLKVKHSTTTFFDSLKRKRVNPLQTTLWCGTARSLKVMLKPHSLITHILFQKKIREKHSGHSGHLLSHASIDWSSTLSAL
jgi:hypothetical protein